MKADKTSRDGKDGYVVGEGSSLYLTRKHIIIMITFVIVVLVGGSMIVVHRQLDDLLTNPKPANTQQSDGKLYSYLAQEAKLDSSEGEYTTAAKNWVNFAQTASSSTSYQNKAWLNAAVLYMSGGEYQAAINAFQKTAAITGITYDDAVGIASAEMRLDNKTAALHYFQTALKLLPSKSNSYEASINRQAVQQEINELNGESS